MQAEQPKYGYGMTAAACLWLGFFPLLQGGTYAHITHDKWIIMLILTGVTLLCFCLDLSVSCIRKKKHPVSPRSALRTPRILLPLLPAAGLLLWTVLACVCSGFPFETWWYGESARMEGLASQLCYFALFFLFFFSRVNLKPVLLAAAAGVTVFFVIVLLQRGGGNPLGLYPSGRSYAKNPEFQGTIGNIDMGTGYLLLLAGLFLHALITRISAFRKSRKPTPRTALHAPLSLIILSLALVLTVFLIITMDVQFGAVSLAVLCLVTVLRFVPGKLRLPLLILLVILVLLAVWFWPGSSGGIWELHEIFHGRARLSFGSNRAAVWLYSLRLARENLLLGGGSGTFVFRFNQFLKDNGLVIPNKQDGRSLPDYFDTPHNEYVAQLTDHGIPALLLYAALLFAAVFRRRERWLPLLSPCSAAVLCYAVQAFFSFSVCIVAPMFWMLLGLSYQENAA